MKRHPSSGLSGPGLAGTPGHDTLADLPPLPTLPPRNRPLWPDAVLEARTETLLCEDRVEGLLRVLVKRVERGLPLSEKALIRVLADPGGGAAARFLQKLLHLRKGSPDRATLDVVSRHLPHLAAHEVHAPALGLLARLAPREHQRAFHEALERSQDWEAKLAAIEGLLAGGAPEADALALRLLDSVSEPMEALSLLPLLVVHGGDEALRRGLHAFAERFSGDQSGAAEVALDWVLRSLDAFGFGNGEELRSDVLLACSAVSPALSRATCPEVFSPSEDPDARRCAYQLFGSGRRHRLARLLASDADSADLALALGKFARQALAHSTRTHPSFAATAARLSVLLDALLDSRLLECLDDLERAVLPQVVGGILARALRGRRPAAEAAAGPLDEEKALELLRIDADWMTPETFPKLAALVGTRDLRKLAGSADPAVRRNAWALLVALAPHKYTPKAMKTALYLAFAPTVRLGLAIEYGGDPVLDSVYTELRAQWRADAIGDLLPWLRSVETERAREYLRVHLDLVSASIRDASPPSHVIEEICFLADADMAGRVAETVRAQGIFPDDAEEFVPSLQALFDLSGLPVVARRVVDDAVRACPFPGLSPDDEIEEPGPFEFGCGQG